MTSRKRYSTDPAIDRSLKHSIRDGVAYSVMSGSSEAYFSAFGLFLKATTTQIAWLASLPALVASLFQLVSVWLGNKTGRRKAIIISGATLQACTLLPLAVLPLAFPDYGVAVLIACAVVYFSGANLAIPQWSSMMGDLVPERRRGRYFGMRTRWATVTSFMSLSAAGLALHLFTVSGATMAGFMLIFFTAAAARFVSVYHLTKMHDPPGHVPTFDVPRMGELWHRIRHSEFARFSAFFAMMQFSVGIASPFYIVYMLRDLGFSYAEFVANTAASVLVQFLTLNRWGRISDMFGNRLILVTTATVIPVMPLMWLVSTDFWYLIAVQIMAGIFWAGFSLSAGNFLYDLVPPSKRTAYLALHNVLTNAAVFLGALLGAFIATHTPSQFSLWGAEISWVSTIYAVFIVSSVGRVIVALSFLPHLKEVRLGRRLSVGAFIFRVARINPLAGLVFDIIAARRRKPPD